MSLLSNIQQSYQGWKNVLGGNTFQGTAPIHTGSWGLPDLGLSETIKPYSPTPAYTPPPTTDKTPPPPGGTPPPSGSLSGSVLGAYTAGGDNGQGSAEDAARAAYEAEVAQQQSLYDRYAAQGQDQITEAGRQKEDALTSLTNALSQASNKVGEQKAESQKLTDSAIGQAGDTARNTQRSNRNVLRALGILNSTYAADKLQEPTNQFDTERARLVQGNIENFRKLDSWFNERQTEHQSNIKSIQSQYATIVDKINTDMRFTEQDRLAALKAANSALQTRLSGLDSEFRQIAQNVDNAKINFATQIANLYLSQNPQANINGILSTAMNTANQAYSPQQVGIEQKKKTLSGV